jgi:inner membrane protein
MQTFDSFILSIQKLSMDSLTHITLGACAGELLLGKKLGKKALFWGALSQSLPDIDTLAALFLPADRAFLFHRGITHSFLFALVIGIGIAVILRQIHRKHDVFLPLLIFFFCFQLALHDLLDVCNSYGTGLLEPFSHWRFTINLLFVADPLFTISLAIATLVLIFKRSNYKYRVRWALGAIGISALYVCFAGINKVIVNNRAEASFAARHIARKRYFTTPTPFNCMLWYIVAADDSGYYTGYSSVWDNGKQSIDYEVHPKNDVLLNQAPDRDVLRHLLTFADDYYTVTQTDTAFYFNILRFGQVQGWRASNAPFVFSYPLSATKGQAILLQKGRLAGWNRSSLKIYIERIAGRHIDKQK